MKIFCNDYKSSLPESDIPTKIGPAGLAKFFSTRLVERGHTWVGLVEDYGNHTLGTKEVNDGKGKKWWILSLPDRYIKDHFTEIAEYKDPEIAGRELIEYIKAVLEKEKPDVVFISGCSAFVWNYVAAARELNLPTVSLHTGMWNLETAVYRDLFSPAGFEVLHTMDQDLGAWPDRHIFLNETSRDYFLKNVYPIPAEKIEIIPLPCEDLAEVTKTQKEKKGDEKNVGIVARWDRIKNHEAFLTLSRTAKAHGKKWNFYSITNFPELDVNPTFHAAYKKEINVLPQIKQTELVSFYKKMDFMVLPSHFDVSPHVVLEAAIQGVPTFISPNVGYASLFAKNGLEDFVIDFSDPEQAFQKIDRMKDMKYPIEFVQLLKKMHDPVTVVSALENVFLKMKK